MNEKMTQLVSDYRREGFGLDGFINSMIEGPIELLIWSTWDMLSKVDSPIRDEVDAYYMIIEGMKNRGLI